MAAKQPFGLASALFSQVQLRILSLFFGEPSRALQVTQIIKLVGSGRGAVQRELVKLVSAGIVDVSVVGSRKVYRANRQSPIFEELHSIILKTVGLLEPIRQALKPFIRNIAVAFVYGSVAKGKDTARSDVDLMIIGRDIAYSDLYVALQRAEKKVMRSINPNLMTPGEWIEKATDKNPFIGKITQQPKLFIFGTDNELKRIAQSG